MKESLNAMILQGMAAKTNFDKVVGKCKLVDGKVEIIETTDEYDPDCYYGLVVPNTAHVVAACITPYLTLGTLGGEIDNVEELLLCPIER